METIRTVEELKATTQAAKAAADAANVAAINARTEYRRLASSLNAATCGWPIGSDVEETSPARRYKRGQWIDSKPRRFRVLGYEPTQVRVRRVLSNGKDLALRFEYIVGNTVRFRAVERGKR